MVNWHPLGTIWHPLEGLGRNLLLVHLSFRALHFERQIVKSYSLPFQQHIVSSCGFMIFWCAALRRQKKSRQSEHKVRFIHWKGYRWIKLVPWKPSYSCDVWWNKLCWCCFRRNDYDSDVEDESDKSHEATQNNGLSYLFHVLYHTLDKT